MGESDSVRANETFRVLLTKWVLGFRVFLKWEFEYVLNNGDFVHENLVEG